MRINQQMPSVSTSFISSDNSSDFSEKVVAKLFEASVEQVKTEDGNIAYVQRPPAPSTDPNDINAQLAALGLGGNQIYKISIGPLDVRSILHLLLPALLLLIKYI